MKKMLLATTLACAIQDVTPATDVYCSKQTGSRQHQAITHHFFVSGVGGRKLSMRRLKFVAAQKMLKQKPSKHS